MLAFDLVQRIRPFWGDATYYMSERDISGALLWDGLLKSVQQRDSAASDHRGSPGYVPSIVKTEVSRLLPNPPVSHFPEEVRMLALITSINTMQSLHDVASPTQRLTSEGKAPRNLLSTLQPDRRSVQDVECLPQPAPYFEPVSI